jgi:hypothetical protein
MQTKKLMLAIFLISLPLCAQNTSAIIYADQYTTPPLNYSYQNIVDNVCPLKGCTIYATSTSASINLGTLDPGNKVVTIYLGPFTYNVDHITLRKGLRIIGMGASDAGTILQSTNASNYPMFVLSQTMASPAVTDVYLYGLRLYAYAGNTSQSGLWLDCSTQNNPGIWHSSFEDLYFGSPTPGDGFHGSAIALFGPTGNANAANQFLSFRNIWAVRPLGAGPDLRMEGYNAQIDCIECHFDGSGPSGDSWANIFLGNLAGGLYVPTSIHFVNLTVQSAALGVQLYGAKNITFISPHHENLYGAYQLQSDGNVSTRGVLISNAFFAGNVGRNNGNGFIVNAISATTITLQSYWFDGLIGPDFVVAGASAGNVSRY